MAARTIGISSRIRTCISCAAPCGNRTWDLPGHKDWIFWALPIELHRSYLWKYTSVHQSTANPQATCTSACSMRLNAGPVTIWTGHYLMGRLEAATCLVLAIIISRPVAALGRTMCISPNQVTMDLATHHACIYTPTSTYTHAFVLKRTLLIHFKMHARMQHCAYYSGKGPFIIIFLGAGWPQCESPRPPPVGLPMSARA